MATDFTNQYEVNILINGKPVTNYYHTDGNVYVEGRKGSSYELEFINKSHNRVLAVPAVDGLSVMDGKTAGLDSDGYVVNPYSKISIPGWRLDDQNVAKFEFGNIGESYSVQSGQGSSNNGVIGFMIFTEKPVQIFPSHYSNLRGLYGSGGFNAGGPYYASPTIDAMPTHSWSDQLSALGSSDTLFGASASCAGPELSVNSIGASLKTASVANHNSRTYPDAASAIPSQIGTSFGDQAVFKTVDVTFNKRDPNNADGLIVIYYDSIDGLRRRGVVTTRSRSPQAFPRYAATKGCKPPAGWR